MTNKIQELAKQAGLKLEDLPDDVFVPLEKFAGLIVKEMLQTCEDHPTWAGRSIGEQIKQRFGVGE